MCVPQCDVGARNQFLKASVHGCSTAASGKFRMHGSKASAYRCPTVVSYKLRCAVRQLRVLLYSSFTNCGVLLGPSFTQLLCAVGAVNQFLTASVRGCSTAASGKFRVQVSKALEYRCPTVVSYKLRCAMVCSSPAANTILLELSQNCAVPCKEPEAQYARTSCPRQTWVYS